MRALGFDLLMRWHRLAIITLLPVPVAAQTIGLPKFSRKYFITASWIFG